MDDDDLTISPQALESYERWRANRLAGLVDLSVEAYNEEKLTLAAVWEQGRKAGAAGKGEGDNPHRGGAL